MLINMAELNQIYRKDPNIVSREIVGEMILVPIRQNIGDLESIYTLNETAARTWELIDGQNTLSDINTRTRDGWCRGLDTALSDLLALIDQLEEAGAVIKVA